MRAAALVFIGMVLLPIGRSTSQEPTILDCPELSECSGLAISGHDSSLVWAHNDSGHAPRLFLLDRTSGALRGTFELGGIGNGDWEDICTFRVGARSYLAVGNIGDNHRRRDSVLIHLLEEPLIPPADTAVTPPTPPTARTVLPVNRLVSIEVNYPDGAVDCESLAFDAQNSRFLLVTKEFFRSRIFGIPLDLKLLERLAPLNSSDGDKSVAKQPVVDVSQPQTIAAEHLQTLLISLATAADISPDGQTLAICTYGPAYLLQRNGTLWSERTMVRVPLPGRRQGESIVFAESDKLVVSSEFVPTPLWTVPIGAPAGRR